MTETTTLQSPVVAQMVVVGNIACTAPQSRLGERLLCLMHRRENIRRTPSLWGQSPNYERAINALKARIA